MFLQQMIASFKKITPVSGGQQVWINLYGAFQSTSLPGWNNFDISQTTMGLLNSAGVDPGFTLSRTGINGSSDGRFPKPIWSDTSFPDDVMDTEWYIGDSEVINFQFSGLNNAKTYIIKSAHYDPFSGVGTTVISFGTETHSVFPGGNPLIVSFGAISPSNGVITGYITGQGAGNPVINGIIIIEN